MLKTPMALIFHTNLISYISIEKEGKMYKVIAYRQQGVAGALGLTNLEKIVLLETDTLDNAKLLLSNINVDFYRKGKDE